MEIIKSNEEIIKGKPKSGRVWKTEHNKFSNLVMQNSQRTSWDKKMQMKREKKLVIEKEKEMKAEAKQNRIVNFCY
jgi:rRNA-processing protein CGR1